MTHGPPAEPPSDCDSSYSRIVAAHPLDAVFRKTKITVVQSSCTQVECRAGTVCIHSPAVFAAGATRWQAFLERIAVLDEVESVEIDRSRCRAQIRLAATRARRQLAVVLDRMAAALASESRMEPGSHALTHLAGRTRIELVRRNRRFSTCRALHEIAGRLRVRDHGLRGRPSIIKQIEQELLRARGIESVCGNSRTGSLVVRFDRRLIGRDSVLDVIDGAIRKVELVALGASSEPREGYTLANAALALATVGEFVLPAVLPASALLLVGSNLGTFRRAWRDLRAGQAGVPLLHSSIVVGTLASGGFLAASIMGWLLLFWQNRHARQLSAARQLLASTIRQQPHAAWVVRDGIELETPIDRLQVGDLVSLRAGELVPADGKLMSGSATLDESPAGGTRSWRHCRPGDALLRGTRLVAGEAKFEIARCGSDTTAEAIGRSIDAAVGDLPLDFKTAPPPIARRVVRPLLLTAGVGLLVGDANTASAILRPDYSTGPGMGDSLLLVDRIAACLQAGVIVRRHDVLERLASITVVLIDDEQAIWSRCLEIIEISGLAPLSQDDVLLCAEAAFRGFDDPRANVLRTACIERGLQPLPGDIPSPGRRDELRYRGHSIRIQGSSSSDHQQNLAETMSISIDCDGRPAGSITFRMSARLAAAYSIQQLRTSCHLQVGYLAAGSEDAASAEAVGLGVDFHEVCRDDSSKTACIERLRKEGHRVAYIGNCEANPAAARAADLRIALGVALRNEAPRVDDPADIWLLKSSYEPLPILWHTIQRSRAQQQMHVGMTLLPNLACIAGAFLLGFSSLPVVLISNLGTLSVYRRSTKAWRRTERRLLECRGAHDNPQNKLPTVAEVS